MQPARGVAHHGIEPVALHRPALLGALLPAAALLDFYLEHLGDDRGLFAGTQPRQIGGLGAGQVAPGQVPHQVADGEDVQ